MSALNSETKSGMIYAVLAYLCWGFFPIYWKFLQHVPLMQILSHRVLWAFVFYTVILVWREKSLRIFRPQTKRLALSLTIASLVLMANWLVYIYAVNSGQIVESSLGYFINPLVNILAGVVFFKERLSRVQTLAAVLAGIGVLIISLDQLRVPWIALFLAVSFSIYGLIKKVHRVSGLKSNQYESVVMVPLALALLLMQSHAWVTSENVVVSTLLLVGSGLVTGLPLIFFAEAAQRLPYYMMGFFQFLAPTLQFLSGVLIFHEPLSRLKLSGFAFIWLAGVMLIFYSWWRHRGGIFRVSGQTAHSSPENKPI